MNKVLISIFGPNKYQLLLAIYIECINSLWDRYSRAFKIKRDWKKKKNLKLNLGCGDSHFENFINIDIVPKASVDIRLDIRRSLPFKDGSVSYIY